MSNEENNLPSKPQVGEFQTVEWDDATNYWLIRDLTPEELEVKLPPPEPGPLSAADVDTERDRRIDGGMTFNGTTFQTDQRSRERIDRARISALAAIMGGAQPGDLRWHGEAVDFTWIAADNTRVTMDAPTMVAFGNAIAAREGMHIIAANDIKSMNPIPEDYATNEAYWP